VFDVAIAMEGDDRDGIISQGTTIIVNDGITGNPILHIKTEIDERRSNIVRRVSQQCAVILDVPRVRIHLRWKPPTALPTADAAFVSGFCLIEQQPEVGKTLLMEATAVISPIDFTEAQRECNSMGDKDETARSAIANDTKQVVLSFMSCSEAFRTEVCSNATVGTFNNELKHRGYMIPKDGITYISSNPTLVQYHSFDTQQRVFDGSEGRDQWTLVLHCSHSERICSLQKGEVLANILR